MAAVFNLGFRELGAPAPPGRSLRVTLVQPSIPQTLIWNTSRDEERFRDLLRLTEQALSNRTDLLLWPEAAVPKLLRYDEEIFTALTTLARRHQAWFIVGSDDFERSPQAATPDAGDYYNSCFLISPEGKLRDGNLIERRLLLDKETRSFMLRPLKHHGRVIGLLGYSSDNPDAFVTFEEGLLDSVLDDFGDFLGSLQSA